MYHYINQIINFITSGLLFLARVHFENLSSLNIMLKMFKDLVIQFYIKTSNNCKKRAHENEMITLSDKRAIFRKI